MGLGFLVLLLPRKVSIISISSIVFWSCNNMTRYSSHEIYYRHLFAYGSL